MWDLLQPFRALLGTGPSDGAPYWTPPGRSGGLVAWVRRQAGQYLGPALSKDTAQERVLTSEKAAANARGIVTPWFLPYIDDATQETVAARKAYRRMLADPNVKAALLAKVLNVASRDLQVLPADKKDAKYRREAEFVRYCLTERVRGCVPELIWAILSGGCVDGYSVLEPVWAHEQKGEWAGKYVLRALKAKVVDDDLALQTDEFRNVVGILGLKYNAGQEFSPDDFLVYRHLPLYDAPTGMSDFRAVYGRFWLLDTVIKLRGVAAEKRALPLLLGHYQNPSVRASLEQALGLARSQNWIAAPESARVEALDWAGQADDIFASFVKDLKHDIFLGIQGAILQALEGETTDGRGNSQVHKSTSELLVEYLVETVQALLNDREGGLVRNLIDLNFATDRYPKVVLSSVDVNELVQELAIDSGLQAMGLDLSKDATYERYGRSPPADPDDVLPGRQQAPGGMGGLEDLFGGKGPGPGRPPERPRPPEPPGTGGLAARHDDQNLLTGPLKPMPFAEHDVSGEPRDESGKWTAGGGGNGSHAPEDRVAAPPEADHNGGMTRLNKEEMEVVRDSGLKSEAEFRALQRDLRPATPADLKKPTINLWHGTSLEAARQIARDGKLKAGPRGRQASADLDHASQYPEDTGADALVLLRARTSELSPDANDQIGETVEDGLFPDGFGSSAEVGGHEVVAVIDITTNARPGEIIEALKKGDLYAAMEHGATVIYKKGLKAGGESSAQRRGGKAAFAGRTPPESQDSTPHAEPAGGSGPAAPFRGVRLSDGWRQYLRG